MNVILLFSGYGGMDLGFRGDFTVFGKYFPKNPYNLIFASDINRAACETFNYNFDHDALVEDVTNIDQLPNADIVIGGFPCQDFSHSGKRRGLTSERGQLYLQMRRVIDTVRPMAFVAENVDGIRTSKEGSDTSALDIIVEDFKSVGYNVKYRILNAADYGVPQTRRRVIIIGSRSDIKKNIRYPKPILKSSEWMTAKDAIDDLWDKIDAPSIYNHASTDYSRAKFYPGKKMQGNYQIKADKPSTIIRAEHHGNIEAHYRTLNPNNPDEMTNWRRLSVRECARLQSFPDDFVFPCSASKAYKQIGNAVPPVMAWYIANALYLSLS